LAKSSKMIPGNFAFTCADSSVSLYIKLFVVQIAYQGSLFFPMDSLI